MAIQQFEGRMASLNSQLNILWDEAIATDNELNLFLKKLETDNVKQFLDIDIVRYEWEVCKFNITHKNIRFEINLHLFYFIFFQNYPMNFEAI